MFHTYTEVKPVTGGQLSTKCFLSIEFTFQVHAPRHVGLSALKSSHLKSGQQSATSSFPVGDRQKVGLHIQEGEG